MHNKTVMCFSKKVCMLDQLHSAQIYSVGCCEFNANESQYGTTIKKERQNSLTIHEAALENVKVTSTEYDEFVENIKKSLFISDKKYSIVDRIVSLKYE